MIAIVLTTLDDQGNIALASELGNLIESIYLFDGGVSLESGDSTQIAVHVTCNDIQALRDAGYTVLESPDDQPTNADVTAIQGKISNILNLLGLTANQARQLSKRELIRRLNQHFDKSQIIRAKRRLQERITGLQQEVVRLTAHIDQLEAEASDLGLEGDSLTGLADDLRAARTKSEARAVFLAIRNLRDESVDNEGTITNQRKYDFYNDWVNQAQELNSRLDSLTNPQILAALGELSDRLDQGADVLYSRQSKILDTDIPELESQITAIQAEITRITP